MDEAGLEESLVEEAEELGDFLLVLLDAVDSVLDEDAQQVNETQFHDVEVIAVGVRFLDKRIDAVHDGREADRADEFVVVGLYA